MKKTKLILKGILLWLTAFVILFSICDIDTTLHRGFIKLLGTTILNLALITTCVKTITEEEFIIISGYEWLGKTLGIKWE